MFGIEKLREEIYDLKESVDDLNQRFQDYIDNEVTFKEMTEMLNSSLKDFEDGFVRNFEEKIKFDGIMTKLGEIIKRLPISPNGIKDKKK